MNYNLVNSSIFLFQIFLAAAIHVILKASIHDQEFKMSNLMRMIAKCVSLLSLFLLSPAWGADQLAPVPAPVAPAVSVAPAVVFDSTVKDNLASIGITYDLAGSTMEVLIDQQKVLSSVPALAKEDIIPKVTASELKKVPTSITVYAVGVPFTIILLSDTYKQSPTLDKVHVDAYMMPTGSTKKELCYSFDYDAAQFGKLNLNTVTANNFITGTAGFKFSLWCKAVLDKEEKVK
jgi:hypothetical protein